MATLSLEEARNIANSLRTLSSNLGDYRFNNWDVLSESDRRKIEGLEWTLLNYSSDMTATAIEIATINIQDQVSHIRAATDRLNGIIDRVNDARKIIAIATKGVILAASIATGNIVAIKEAADKLLDEVG